MVEDNDNHHRNKNGEISHKHGSTLPRDVAEALRTEFSETEKLSEVLPKLNEWSLTQLRCDHETGHFEHKTATTSK
jgi:hypothetical protein